MVSLITTSWIIDSLLIFIPLLLFGLYKLKKKYDYFKDRGIPYYKSGINVINFKVMLLKETVEDAFDKIYKKFPLDRYIGIPSIIGPPSIMIMDPELIEKMLIKDFSYFHDRNLVEPDIKLSPLESNLFSLKGQMWRTLRAKLSPTFTSGKLKWMFGQISSCTDILLEYLNEKANGEDFLIREIISCYGFDIIASCAFGIDAQTQKNPNSEFRQMALKVFKPSVSTMIKGTIRFLFPKICQKLGIGSIDPEISDFFLNLTKTAMENRKKSGISRNDFVQLLLQLKEKGYVEFDAGEESELENRDFFHEKLEFSDELLTAQVFIFFLAGFEPVATLIMYTLYSISKESDVQSKAREEILRVKEKYGEINYESLKEMTYLESVITESLRMFPPARLIIRICSKDYKLDDGHTIEKDSMILIPTYSLQLDEKHFPNPLEFKPERFIDPSELSVTKGRGLFLPFGDGPRVCIARRFALLEAKLAIARIIESFKMFHSSKNINPMQRNPKSFVIEPIGGLWIRMEKIVNDKTNE